MKYVLGLDIGITSVGWSVLNLDEHRIEDLGVRGFNAAEDAKTKASLAEPRRLARGTRRRLRRRAGRLRRAKDLFVHYELIREQDRDSAFTTRSDRLEPWQLRYEGLDRLLTGEEFARALFHIAKRRGFKSNKKATKKSDDGKALSGIEENRQLLERYRTAGEMIWRKEDKKFQDRKKNTTGDYRKTLSRSMLEDEIKALFAAQRREGSGFAGAEIEERFLEVFNWQKPFASGEDILRKVGPCTFEPDEKRAPKRSYTVERFDLLHKINSLTYSINGDRCGLSDEQRRMLVALAYSLDKPKYARIRKELCLPEEARFTALRYVRKQEGGGWTEDVATAEKSEFFSLKGYHEIKKKCEKAGVWDRVKDSPDVMDAAAYALTFYKNEDEIRRTLAENAVPDNVAEAVRDCDGFSGVSHLSWKAIKNILPFMEDGLRYDEACEKAGYDHSSPRAGDKQDKLPVIEPEDVRNPVVLRALSQARKVVNAIIARCGAPYRIHIELAREMGKSAEERDKISGRQEENRRDNERRAQEFREAFNLDRSPTGTELLKWRFYREQNGQCAYSQKPIDLNRFFEDGYTEIDHIIPYSRSFDDSLSNRALVLTSENQNKGNKIPFEFFGHEARWHTFEAWVKAPTIKNPRKRENLLRKKFDEEDEKQWKKRNLNDTSYVTLLFSRFLRENLRFANEEKEQAVICLNGQVVARARWLWGLPKEREEDDLHHALDATVVAALLPHNVEMITAYSKVGETRQRYVDRETGEIIEWVENKRPKLPRPWKGFCEELMTRLADVIVSRMPQRKATGELHRQTIRSVKRLAADGISAVRTRLTELKEKDLANLFAPETNERLYEAIRNRMSAHDHNAKKAFAEPLHKPTDGGSPGPIVRSVKVAQTQTTGVRVRGGTADNGDMVRTDVFKKDGKYYLVPVYVKDFMQKKLPNRAIAKKKPEKEWPVIDSSYEFVCTLYPYDLVRIKTKKEEFFGYYRGTDRSDGRITVSKPNKNGDCRRTGTKEAILIEKYEMGILGDYHPVRKEVRRGVENRRNLQSREAEA